MKAKKLNKKLTLNKETVAALNSDAMSGVKGGIYTVAYTCGMDCDTDFTCGRATYCDDCWTVVPVFC